MIFKKGPISLPYICIAIAKKNAFKLLNLFCVKLSVAYITKDQLNGRCHQGKGCYEQDLFMVLS